MFTITVADSGRQWQTVADSGRQLSQTVAVMADSGRHVADMWQMGTKTHLFRVFLYSIILVIIYYG
jgi:hypothetical protein